MRTLAYGLCLAVLLVTGADAAVLCKKPSGAVAIRDTACKKKEVAVDLATLGARDTLGGLSCTAGQGVQWNGTAWACATDAGIPDNLSVVGNLSVGGTTDLLGNSATNGRIADFTDGDPQTQTNLSYDLANAVRLPIYSTTVVGSGDLTALCRTGDVVLSGGCVTSNTCYLSRSYPIPLPPSGQSGWHCRGLTLASSTACTLTAIAHCAKSF